MEGEVPPVRLEPTEWGAVSAAALPPAEARAIASELAEARRPLVVTSYVGRDLAAVGELIQLCRRLGAGVMESVPSYFNFPTDDPLYQGNQWNDPTQHPALAGADLVLVVDSDVPWIPVVNRPRHGARIIHIDVDPLKQQMPLWYIPAQRRYRADAAVALGQINQALDVTGVDERARVERAAYHAALHETRQRILDAREQEGDVITPAYLTSRVRRLVDDDTIVLNEGITSYGTIVDHLRLTRPGSLFASGGGSLGWNGGAAIGVKLAAPDKTVISLTGDGSYLFSIPSVVHWMARRYRTPFLQVVYNNGGWKAPKFSTLAIHPSGHASRAEELGVSFAPPPDHAGIAAAAGGAFARTVRRRDELDGALDEAMRCVKIERRAAVLDVLLPPL
jgi:acetolactate synthase I/II/III large subunit